MVIVVWKTQTILNSFGKGVNGYVEKPIPAGCFLVVSGQRCLTRPAKWKKWLQRAGGVASYEVNGGAPLLWLQNAMRFPSLQVGTCEGKVVCSPSGRKAQQGWMIQAGDNEFFRVSKVQNHTHKVVLRQQTEITVRCPKCGDPKTLSIEKYGKERWLRIICACKLAFDVEFEHRNKFRKQTALSGYMERVGTRVNNVDRLAKVRWETESIVRPNCTVVNLSVDGVGIATGGRHDIKVDDLLRVRFLLDDSVGTIIEKLYLVISAKDEYLGCKNHKPDRHDQKLGFYVLS